MTTKSILAHWLCFSLASTFALAEKSEPAQGEIKGINLASPDFKKLFDGKTLDGWEILPGGQWKVDNGVIVGQQDKTEKRHGMLLSKKVYTDFVVKLKYKSMKGNSGLPFYGMTRLRRISSRLESL